jgi:hypothetical protein
MGREADPLVEQARQNHAREVDLNGQLVAPGFIDAHCHVSALGGALDKLDLGYCKNLADIRATILGYASQNASARMILCRG